MAIAIASRPLAWSPALNPIIYKFTVTGSFTNYFVRVGVFRKIDDVQIGINKDYYQGTTATITVDVSDVLVSYLSKDTASVAVSEDQITSVEVYIKYQEFYIGSGSSLQNDSTKTFIAILAGLKIGSNGDMTKYVLFGPTSLLPCIAEVLNLWMGYLFSVSFIAPVVSISYTLESYDDSNTLLGSVTNLIASVVIGVNKYTLAQADIFTGATYLKLWFSYSITYPADYTTWANFGSPFTKTSTTLAKTSMVNSTLYGAAHGITTIKAGIVPNNLAIGYSSTVISGQIQVKIEYVDNLGFVKSSDTKTITTSTAGTLNFTFAALTGDVTAIQVSATTVASGGTNAIQLGITTADIFSTPVANVVKRINIKEPCRNPLYLAWKNSVGGDAYWMFDNNQDYTFAYNNSIKAPRKIGYTIDLTQDQWEAIDELNTPGVVLKKPVVDSISTINKVTFKTDQQVYAIDAAGNRIGVVVIQRPSLTQTKKYRHLQQVEIELPYLFL
jgi:hypothetical protein